MVCLRRRMSAWKRITLHVFYLIFAFGKGWPYEELKYWSTKGMRKLRGDFKWKDRKQLTLITWWCGGLIVSTLPSTLFERSWFECLPGTLYYVVLLGKTLVFLSTQVYKWVPATLMREHNPGIDWYPIQGGVEILLVTSCHANPPGCKW